MNNCVLRECVSQREVLLGESRPETHPHSNSALVWVKVRSVYTDEIETERAPKFGEEGSQWLSCGLRLTGCFTGYCRFIFSVFIIFMVKVKPSRRTVCCFYYYFSWYLYFLTKFSLKKQKCPNKILYNKKSTVHSDFRFDLNRKFKKYIFKIK